MSKEYQCALCRGVFEEGQSEEECMAEYEAAFPASAAAGVPFDVVCDDCYRKMTGELPPKEWEAEGGGEP
jgi:hypothetical protein